MSRFLTLSRNSLGVSTNIHLSPLLRFRRRTSLASSGLLNTAFCSDLQPRCEGKCLPWSASPGTAINQESDKPRSGDIFIAWGVSPRKRDQQQKQAPEGRQTASWHEETATPFPKRREASDGRRRVSSGPARGVLTKRVVEGCKPMSS